MIRLLAWLLFPLYRWANRWLDRIDAEEAARARGEPWPPTTRPDPTDREWR